MRLHEVAKALKESLLIKSSGALLLLGAEVAHKFEARVEEERLEREIVDVVATDGLRELLAELLEELKQC